METVVGCDDINGSEQFKIDLIVWKPDLEGAGRTI